MDRTAIVVVVLATALLAGGTDRRTAVPDDASRPTWARAVAKFTWRTTTTTRGRIGQGTAVLVSPRLVMTAYHCVKLNGGRGTLRFGFDGIARTVIEQREATGIVSSSAAGDWAILRLDRPVTTIPPLVMAAQRIQKYDPKRMLLAGYSCDRTTGRGGLVLTCDAKAKARKVRSAEGRLLTDAVCHSGASGGPAFVRDKGDTRWHWVGLVQGNLNIRDKQNFVTYAVYQPAYAAALRAALATNR